MFLLFKNSKNNYIVICQLRVVGKYLLKARTKLNRANFEILHRQRL